MASFLLVSCFLLGASAQASYALTELPLSTIVVDTYLMGFVGEMMPQLFMEQGSSLESGRDMSDMSAARVSRTGFGYVLLCLSSFIIMVSMANIFIQVMGDAYNDNKDRVQITLTRARAEESLITALWKAGGASLLPRRCSRLDQQGRREFVWFTQEGRSALPSPPDSAEGERGGSTLPRMLPHLAGPAGCARTSRLTDALSSVDPRTQLGSLPSSLSALRPTLLTRGARRAGGPRAARDAK
jgi:hypothetical protein